MKIKNILRKPPQNNGCRLIENLLEGRNVPYIFFRQFILKQKICVSFIFWFTLSVRLIFIITHTFF